MSKSNEVSEVRVSRWYFGGLSAAGACCFTHPLDLLKVNLQTQKGKNVTIFQCAAVVVRNKGIQGLYNGLSASVLRQLLYSTTRFGIYDGVKLYLVKRDGKPMSFQTSAMLAAFGGFVGGFVGNPADLVNVRMENDVKLPPSQRRNYKNALHGLYTVATTEGITRLWAGATLTSTRAAFMTIGQVAFYELIKYALLSTAYFHENMITHVTASSGAGLVATTLTQPMDVLKTRAMNSKPGEVSSMLRLMTETTKEGPLAFFKGYVAAFTRLTPHTILTFVFLEKLTQYFGIVTHTSVVQRQV